MPRGEGGILCTDSMRLEVQVCESETHRSSFPGFPLPNPSPSTNHTHAHGPGRHVGGAILIQSVLNMFNSVVLPELSSPRKRMGTGGTHRPAGRRHCSM